MSGRVRLTLAPFPLRLSHRRQDGRSLPPLSRHRNQSLFRRLLSGDHMAARERNRPSTGIELEENLRFQERMWLIERIGWCGMGVILLAAAAGVFGHGPVSRATLQAVNPGQPAQGVTLEYERFGRAHRESQLIFSQPAGAPGGTFTLWFSGDYLSGAELLRITPDPFGQDLVANGVRYHFRLQEGPHRVMFRFKPEGPGRLSGAFRFNDGPPVTFHQWLFP